MHVIPVWFWPESSCKTSFNAGFPITPFGNDENDRVDLETGNFFWGPAFHFGNQNKEALCP
jgi:hypothetical protein